MGHKTDKSRTEDITTNQRAHRHPDKSINITEDAQNVMNDNVGKIDPLGADEMENARNKATEGIRQGRNKSEQ